MLGEQATSLWGNLLVVGLGLRLLRHRPIQLVELDDAFVVPTDEVFDASKNPHVESLTHVGGVGDEEEHHHIVPPQELDKWLHRVAGAAVKDEDRAVVVVAQLLV